jgi:hypothetical protein
VNLERVLRGKLAAIAASFVLFVSTEILKWQFPVVAAGEKLRFLAPIFGWQGSDTHEQITSH